MEPQIAQSCESLLRKLGEDDKEIASTLARFEHDKVGNDICAYNENDTLPFDPLPNDLSLDLTKLKVFADDKIKFAKMRISSFDRVENTENTVGSQHFLLFLQCFPKLSSLWL